MQTLPVNNNLETVQSTEIDFLRELPAELNGISADVWSILSPDQKKDILRQRGLYEKYVNPQQEVPVEIPVESQNIQPEAAPEQPRVEVIENIRPVESEIAQMSQAVMEKERSFNENEVKHEEQPVINHDEQQRIAQETAQSSNTMSSPKLFGYQVPANTVQNAGNISDDGNIEDGSTWAATLIKKIFAIFGE